MMNCGADIMMMVAIAVAGVYRENVRQCKANGVHMNGVGAIKHADGYNV